MKSLTLGAPYKKIFMIGIGGISMSGFAEMLYLEGYDVSGSDISDSPAVSHLKELGIKVHTGHNAENITDDIDLVIYTAAVKEDNPELKAAQNKKIDTFDRAWLLGKISDNFPLSVGVAGMHGKTSTTSMIACAALSENPTISVGGYLNAINGNFRIGDSDIFIYEACEYCDSFLKFYPAIGTILNIEEDHLDYFKDINHIRRSFKHYANNISNTLVINGNIQKPEEIIEGISAKVITFGNKDCDIYCDNIEYDLRGLSSFDLFHNKKFVSRLHLKTPGNHNVENSLAAFAVCTALNLETEEILRSLSEFTGANRRFEYKGVYNGATIIDDYAHHPTEIRSTLKSAAAMDYKKVWCLFQPHTFTRTIALFDDLAKGLSYADTTLLVDIYPAREEDLGVIHSKDLVDALNRNNNHAVYLESFETAKNYLQENLSPGDLLITMGAGDVYLVGESILLTELSTLSTI